MNEEKISEAQERQLLAAVRQAVAQTNTGVDPNEALAKSAAENNYGPDFVNRMVEMYNTSRTLAHFKQASGPARASDFPIADSSKILQSMFSVNSQRGPLRVEEMGKAANFMAIKKYDEMPAFEKAAAYRHDGSAKFQKVLNSISDIEQDISNLCTKKAEAELRRDAALVKAGSYFRQAGHASFEDVDARMQSMFGKMGKMAMDVIWETAEGLRGEKRAEAPSVPMLAEQTEAPYSYINEFIESTKSMLKYASRVDRKKQELDEIKKATRSRITKSASTMLGLGALGALADPIMDPDPYRPKSKTDMSKAIDPAHENRLRGIKMQAQLQEMMATDPVISEYDPNDVLDAFNEISRLSPTASMQPIIMRGYLRRLLESSPDTAGRVLEGHEASQLAELEKTMRPTPSEVDSVMTELKGA